MKPRHDKEVYDLMHKNPNNWKIGIFYFNNDDPRILVPKRNPSMGWTLNFASPFSYIALIALASLILIISMIGK